MGDTRENDFICEEALPKAGAERQGVQSHRLLSLAFFYSLQSLSAPCWLSNPLSKVASLDAVQISSV